MKATKRILATLMTIIMLVGLLAVPAMAADITIKDTNNDNYYTIYKIFEYDAANSADGKPLFKPADGWENFSADSYFRLLNGYVVWAAGSDATTGAAFAAVAKDYVTDSTPVIAGPKQVSSQVVTFDGLAQGYYLILVTDAKGNYKDGTTCGVVAVLDNVTINAKDTVTGLPIVEKKVSDNLTIPNWADSNSVEIGSIVKFQTTVTAKVATAAYVLHDTMADGFTFNNDVSITLNGASVDTANYSVATAPTTGDSCSFHVTFTDSFCKKLHSNDSIVVSYTATLNNKAKTAETSTTGNNNAVYLSYTENSTAKSTDPATTSTYTYQIDVIKKDSKTLGVLAGADFQLKNDEGKFVNVDGSGFFTNWDTTGSTFTSGNDGKFTIIGLDAGTYTLVETKAPAGYIKAEDTTIQITDANKTVDVVNTPGVELPETGGMGTTLFYVAGGVLVLGAFVVLMKKRGEQK